jgi:predicted metalloprotease with PDZ domain
MRARRSLAARSRSPSWLLSGAALVALVQPAARAAPAGAAPTAGAAGPRLVLAVDASDAPRHILHATETIPVAAGALTLYYAQWIPGEHGPTGPVVNLTGLKFLAGNRGPLAWRRDPVDMYALHIDIPAGVSSLTVQLDYLEPSTQTGYSSAASGSAELVLVSWNHVLLYPKGFAASDITVAPSLKLPAGWQLGTALEGASQGSPVSFAPVSLERLVDSPVLAGAHLRTVPIGDDPIRHRVILAADTEAALEVRPETIAHWKRLVAETGALYVARHYRHYDFLITLSDVTAHFGLEHHESSDDRIPERSYIDDDHLRLHAGLLPHEFTHSWNGKYRRPAGLLSPDFQKPMQGDLLWIYEGLTQYLGTVLTARSGLRTLEDSLDEIAEVAASLDHESGRSWRPLADTAVTAQLLYGAPVQGATWRRGVDFYPESVLIWLEADTIIRQQTRGERSLDDFCHKFFGGTGAGPQVVPYALEDVLRLLGEVAPYDWKGFFHDRIEAVQPRAPLGGIQNAGWRLVYNERLPPLLKAREMVDKLDQEMFTIGAIIKDVGKDNGREGAIVEDVVRGMAADKAGVAPGMRLVAVNGHAYSREGLRDAIRAARGKKDPIQILAQNGQSFLTFRLDYHDGLRFPHLERDGGKPDLLGDILRPHAAAK